MLRAVKPSKTEAWKVLVMEHPLTPSQTWRTVWLNSSQDGRNFCCTYSQPTVSTLMVPAAPHTDVMLLYMLRAVKPSKTEAWKVLVMEHPLRPSQTWRTVWLNSTQHGRNFCFTYSQPTVSTLMVPAAPHTDVMLLYMLRAVKPSKTEAWKVLVMEHPLRPSQTWRTVWLNSTQHGRNFCFTYSQPTVSTLMVPAAPHTDVMLLYALSR